MSAFGPLKKRYIDKYSYSVSKVLGEGYSGTVHLGKNEETGKHCAIKIIEKSILKYQAHKSMILCEIQFLRILKGSQKILTLHEVYNTKNNIYLVLELCNTDLKQYIHAKKYLSEAQAIDILKNIITGYKAIWKANIVHRDLKPSNILLQGEQIKIEDFGFSMYEKDQKQFQKINVGSPYYMPFEVLTYNMYSYQSDIWALGIIFFEMLTGKLPWKAKTEKQLFKEMKEFDIQKLMPNNISQSSKQFLSKTLSMDPNKRMKPEQLVEFRFSLMYLNVDKLFKKIYHGSRMSTRSYEAKSIQKSKRKSLTIHDPAENSRMKKKQTDEAQIQEFDIEVEVTDQDKNNLAHSRMKKQNNEESVDQVNQLPDSTKKKKVICDSNTSLQTRCDVFEVDQINETPHAPNPSKPSKKSSYSQKLLNTNKNQKNTSTFYPEEYKPKNESHSWTIKVNYVQKQQKNKEEEQNKHEKNKEIMRNFSKTLRGQIHFCRYLFKLLIRVIQHIPDSLNLVKPELKGQMAAFIFAKLKRILKQKISNPIIFKEWLQTKQWQKIKAIVKQYKNKYIESLKYLDIPKEFDNELFKKLLRKAILLLYKRAYDAYITEQERQQNESDNQLKRTLSQKSTEQVEDDESYIMKIKEQILVLDYFITLKQLHMLEERYGWEVFQQKSKIQRIVDGQPLSYIQKKHIVSISSKLGALKIL